MLGHTGVRHALLLLLNCVLCPQTLLSSVAPGLAASVMPGVLQTQERRKNARARVLICVLLPRSTPHLASALVRWVRFIHSRITRSLLQQWAGQGGGILGAGTQRQVRPVPVL